MVDDSFSSVLSAAEELHTSTAYYWENDRRENEQNTLGVQLTLAGAAFFRDGHGRRLVPAGHAMLFTHREPTSYGYPGELTEPYRLRYLSFLPAPTIEPLFTQLRTDFNSVLPMAPRSDSEMLFTEVFRRYQERSFRDRFHESELLHLLLIELYREQVQETHTSDPIEFGYHYVRNHFRSPVNLKTVAEKCGISREHFIRQFSQRYGESPGGLLRRLRLEHARAMLAATELTVEEVALASGFTSCNTFGRAYRQKFGRSPRTQR